MCLFVWKVEWQRDKEWVVPFAGSLPKWSQKLGLSQAEARGQEFLLVLPGMWLGAQWFESSFAASPGTFTGSWIRNSQDLNLCSHMGCQHCKHWLNLYATAFYFNTLLSVSGYLHLFYTSINNMDLAIKNKIAFRLHFWRQLFHKKQMPAPLFEAVCWSSL